MARPMLSRQANIIRRLFGGVRHALRDERGISVVEALVAVAILGTIVVGLIAIFGTGSLAVRTVDIAAAGERLATNQLEYTKSYPYDAGATGYPLVDAPPGYDLAVTVQPVPGADAAIQKVTVTVSYEGEVVLAVENYKVAR